MLVLQAVKQYVMVKRSRVLLWSWIQKPEWVSLAVKLGTRRKPFNTRWTFGKSKERAGLTQRRALAVQMAGMACVERPKCVLCSLEWAVVKERERKRVRGRAAGARAKR